MASIQFTRSISRKYDLSFFRDPNCMKISNLYTFHSQLIQIHFHRVEKQMAQLANLFCDTFIWIMMYLEGGTSCVAGIWLNLNGFLKHDAESGVGTITLKCCVILSTYLTTICMNYLQRKQSFHERCAFSSW